MPDGAYHVATELYAYPSVPDGVNHVAFAYSADGKDRFTTVYPALNLLDGSDLEDYTKKKEHLTIVQKDGGCYNETYISASYSNPEPNSFTDIVSWKLEKERLEPSTTYTFSFALRGKGTVTTYIHPSLIDTSSNTYADGKLTKPDSEGRNTWTSTSEWVRHTYTFTTKSSITEDQHILFLLPTGSSVDICLPKLEKGSTATHWMPSASEVKAKHYPSYIGTYTDNKPNEQSTDPEKYTWKKIEQGKGI